MLTKTCTIEYLHSYLLGSGARFTKDSLRDVLAQLKNFNRRERDQVMRDMGLKRVRGALGGVYWE